MEKLHLQLVISAPAMKSLTRCLYLFTQSFQLPFYFKCFFFWWPSISPQHWVNVDISCFVYLYFAYSGLLLNVEAKHKLKMLAKVESFARKRYREYQTGYTSIFWTTYRHWGAPWGEVELIACVCVCVCVWTTHTIYSPPPPVSPCTRRAWRGGELRVSEHRGRPAAHQGCHHLGWWGDDSEQMSPKCFLHIQATWTSGRVLLTYDLSLFIFERLTIVCRSE